MTTPSVVNVYPPNGAVGITIGDTVRVTFDQEMDLTTINTGTFVLTGPDTAPVVGPIDVTPLDAPGFEDEDILSSPYFGAYVKGTITFQRVNASGGEISDSIVDYTGLGTLWYTKAIFTPSAPLAPNSQYTVILLADEVSDDSIKTGIRNRSVFDTRKIAGTGTGNITFDGGYSGEVQTKYVIEITVGGACGTAEYIWWNDSDPLTTFDGLTTTGERELENDVYVTCDPDGTFVVGDKFEVVVVPSVSIASNYRWTFNTGSGSILIPPSTYSTSGIEDLAAGAGLLKILEVTPADRATNQSIANSQIITIKFNKSIDESTVNNNTVSVLAQAVNGMSDIVADGKMATLLSVSGDTITIQLI